MLRAPFGLSVQFVDLVGEYLSVTDLFSLSYVDKSFRRFRGRAVKYKTTASLELFHKKLKGISADIGQCTALRSLDLGDNQLTSLPAEIGQCTALQWF